MTMSHLLPPRRHPLSFPVMSESNSQKALLATVDIRLPKLYPGGMKIPHLDTESTIGYKVLISTWAVREDLYFSFIGLIDFSDIVMLRSGPNSCCQ